MLHVSAFHLKNSLCNLSNPLQQSVMFRSWQHFSLFCIYPEDKFSFFLYPHHSQINFGSWDARPMQSLIDNLFLISSQMLSCQLKGNLKLSLLLSLLHLPSFMIIGHKTIARSSPAPVTPVPPFIQAVACIDMLITQIFSAQYLKSMDTIQLLLCTAGFSLDRCSVLFSSLPKHYFASPPPNY